MSKTICLDDSPMARTPKDVTDAELAVLQALWDGGPASIRELVDRLYPGGSNSEYATVQKLSERLLDKGYVARDRRRRPNQFRAALGREELIGRRLRSMADKLCSGSYIPLLSHLVQGGSLTREEIAALRDQVEALDGKARRGSE